MAAARLHAANNGAIVNATAIAAIVSNGGRKGEGEGGAIATLFHDDFSLIIAVTLTFI